MTDENIENQERFFEPKKKLPTTLTPVTIFLSVLAAVIVALLLKDAYDEYRLRRTVSEFVQGVKVISDEMDKEVKKMEVENSRLINRTMHDTQRSFKRVAPSPIETGLMNDEHIEELEGNYGEEME